MQDRVGVIGTASVHSIRHFQAPYDLAFVARNHLDQIPALAYVQEGGLFGKVGERRREVVVGVGQALEDHARTYVVIQDYEGMVPGLQDIVHIAVDDHVGREFVQLHPLVPVAVQGLLHVSVKARHAACEDLLHAPCSLFGIARGMVDRRSPYQDEDAEYQQSP